MFDPNQANLSPGRKFYYDCKSMPESHTNKFLRMKATHTTNMFSFASKRKTGQQALNAGLVQSIPAIRHFNTGVVKHIPANRLIVQLSLVQSIPAYGNIALAPYTVFTCRQAYIVSSSVQSIPPNRRIIAHAHYSIFLLTRTHRAQPRCSLSLHTGI